MECGEDEAPGALDATRAREEEAVSDGIGRLFLFQSYRPLDKSEHHQAILLADGAGGNSAGSDGTDDCPGDRDTGNSSSSLSQTLSSREASLAVIKCAIGAGSFSLPYAFQNGGLYASIVLTLAIGALCAYTAYLLTLCKRLVGTSCAEWSEQSRPLIAYSDLGRASFPRSNVKWGRMSINPMECIILLGCLFTTIGVSASYIDFIAEMIQKICIQFSSHCGALTTQTVILLFLPVILFLSFLNSYRSMIITSLIGNVAVIVGCLTVIVYGYSQSDRRSIDSAFHHSIIHMDTLYRFFGVSGFLFTVHVVIMPLLQQVRVESQVPRVISGSYLFITLFNTLFGAVGFALFSESECVTPDSVDSGPCSNILANLQSSLFVTLVRLLVCIDLLFSIPLVLAAGRQIVQQVAQSATRQLSNSRDLEVINLGASTHPLHDAVPNLDLGTEMEASPKDQTAEPNRVGTWVHHGSIGLYFDALSRVLLCVLTISLSLAIPKFGDAVSFVGGLVGSLNAYIYPVILYLRLSALYSTQRTSYLTTLLHYFILFVGASILVLSLLPFLI